MIDGSGTVVDEMPQYSARQLTLGVSGSVNAALVPHWLLWMRHLYPHVRTDVVVTKSAERFVTVEALRLIATGSVWRDSWDEAFPDGSWTGIEASSTAYAVFPATLDLSMRLANGSTNTPLLMALQCTSKPIVLAPAFPGSNEIVEARLEDLERRANVALVDHMPAYSLGSKSWSGRTGFLLPAVLQLLDSMIEASRTVPAPDDVQT